MLATIGGQENAFTTADYTGYFQRVPRESLGDVMAFEADRMTGLVLSVVLDGLTWTAALLFPALWLACTLAATRVSRRARH
jgi:hypothetical protein